MVRRMIRILLTFLGFAMLAAPAAAAERRYSVTDFDRVVVEGPYIVRLTTGRSSSAVASGPQAGIDRILVDVSGTTLRVRRNRNAWGASQSGQPGVVEITLATRNLRSARVIGPGRLEIDGAEGMRVDLTLEGSGEIRAANIAADNLSLGLLGSGRIEVAGRARNLRGDFQGTGNVDASALAAEDAIVSSTTVGPVILNAARTARVTNNGLGDVTILGRAACTLTGPGAAQVSCGATDGR